MTSIVRQESSILIISNIVENSTERSLSENNTLKTEKCPSSRDNFPKGLRGGGGGCDIIICECLWWLCYCCALEAAGII
ncbi:unnamed protein product [Adineta steineri]|uniref:Uncharacterized protein n=1 Tax=Adineta steineri TaxID=433720 RepID=A0A814PQJ3_9BILA|nr:unnamed protein product [Adineta steineri]CAF3834839.1 unnamed protein product [Adineta steineri]